MPFNRKTSVIAMLLVALAGGCVSGRPPEGIVRGMVEPFMDLDWPLYYWETSNGKTAVYRMVDSTNDVNTLLWNLEGVRAVRSSDSAIYILRDDEDGNLMLTRLERDSRRTTDSDLSMDISATRQRPWVVGRTDAVAVSGVGPDGENRIVVSTWTRTEPEETFRQDIVPEATIEHSEVEWLSTRGEIGEMSISGDGSRIASALALEDGSGYGLYFIDGPDAEPVRVGEYPVIELGGFSPDDTKFAAAFQIEGRVDVFIIDAATLEMEAVTRVATGFRVGNPSWHPNGQYLLYTTDYMTEYISGTTPLSGKQLFIYHVPSRNTRRLTAFEDTDLRIDFAPNGDFLLYSSVPGVLGGRGRAVPSRDPEERERQQANLETWKVFYVPWDSEEFLTSIGTSLRPEDLQFLVSWTVGGEGEIGFAWGPEPEAP